MRTLVALVPLFAVACGQVKVSGDAGSDGGSHDAGAPDAEVPGCGDGVVEAPEACDPGVDACCNATCTGPASASALCRPSAGACDPAERCTGAAPACPPDAVAVDGTPCDDCPGPGACDDCRAGICVNRCGNGDLDEGEECDDGALNSDTIPDACRADCRLPACGDGVTDTGEECDDGALNSDTIPDACRTGCELPFCGDRVTDGGEECDGGFHCIATCHIAEQLDVVLLVDLSGSFTSLVDDIASQAPGMLAALDALHPGVRIGVASFIDKPVAPFGVSTDHVYMTRLKPTASAAVLQSTLAGLTAGSGNDAPEAQIEATMQAALRQTEVGWDPNRWRAVIVITDNTFHQAGDFTTVPANDLDAVLDGSPPGAGEDYPSKAAVGTLLAANRVLPGFVSSGSLPAYDALVAGWGFGATNAMAADASNLTAAVVNVVTALAP